MSTTRRAAPPPSCERRAITKLLDFVAQARGQILRSVDRSPGGIVAEPRTPRCRAAPAGVRSYQRDGLDRDSARRAVRAWRRTPAPRAVGPRCRACRGSSNSRPARAPSGRPASAERQTTPSASRCDSRAQTRAYAIAPPRNSALSRRGHQRPSPRSERASSLERTVSHASTANANCSLSRSQ